MSGEEKLEQSLDELDLKIKIDINSAPEYELSGLIQLAESAERLSSSDCYELAIKFNTFSLYIKRLYNREVAKKNTYTSAINRVSSKHWNDYGNIFGNDIKINMIANEYEQVREYLNAKEKAQRAIDELEGLSLTIDKYISLLQNYGRKKDD